MTNVYEAYDRRNYLALELAIEEDKHISPEELIAAMKYSGDKLIPLAVREKICAGLAGEIKKPKGRKPADDWEYLRRMHAVALYKRYLRWLQRREEKHGLEGWEYLKNMDWWQGPPHERAARMVKRRVLRHLHWRTVLRYVSVYG